MSRAKTKRPGARNTGANPTVRRPTGIPDDLPNAAVAALDDLLTGGHEIVQQPPPPKRRGNPFDTDVAPTVSRANAHPGTDAKVPALPPPPKTGKKREPTSAPLDDSQLLEVTELPKVPALRFAVWEDSANLSAAQGAIVAAGQVVSVGASGANGGNRVIETVRRGGIDVLVVALPGGEAIIDAVIALEKKPIVIAAMAGEPTNAIARANAAGADLVTLRPHDVERVAPLVLAAARLSADRSAAAMARGNEAVLRARLEGITEAEPGGLQPFELFQRALELEIKRARRYEYALSVALFAVETDKPAPAAGIRGILRARAGTALITSIRDIDLATQLDHERFLVLLPYTDLTGAAGLARRVIAAVAKLDPVTSAGRAYAPRLVGAVAGSRPDRELSFAKLMKDATQALVQARKDGAELAVQP